MSDPQSPDGITIAADSPMADDLALIFERHTADMHAQTPQDSIHMLPRGDLVAPDIRFYVMRDQGRAIGMAALKFHDADMAEVKSMHLLAEARGHGLSARMMDHLLAQARDKGITRLSLETGVEPVFAPARALYRRAGFVETGPFADYDADPNSLFMTRTL